MGACFIRVPDYVSSARIVCDSFDATVARPECGIGVTRGCCLTCVFRTCLSMWLSVVRVRSRNVTAGHMNTASVVCQRGIRMLSAKSVSVTLSRMPIGNDLGVSLPGHQRCGGDATVMPAEPAYTWCRTSASCPISRKRLRSLRSAIRLMLRMLYVMLMYRRRRARACGVVMCFLIGDMCVIRSVTIVNTGSRSRNNSFFSFFFWGLDSGREVDGRRRSSRIQGARTKQ